MPHTILGIPFYDGDVDGAVRSAANGGLVVAPSGPGLAVDLVRDQTYREAVQTADLVLPDSGYMVLLLRLLGQTDPKNPLRRLSGLAFLRALLDETELRRDGATFWVMPSEAEKVRTMTYLRGRGFDHLTDEDCYLAPRYRTSGNENAPIQDEALALILEARKPQWVILNVGGGIQEPLGVWLRNRLSYRPAIICTGAAIAFLSGGQAEIPPWADRLYLGWLLRIISAPASYVPRYANAARLGWLMARWKDRMPPLHT
ncbi:WecB/TagA/CpsF family glycosyltransferase [Roseimicrobium sp. ORNL1]|uniref:WecB/TagA/CpsF family glycosyltransferase n=1 Tax=Roseimicrobium sp. ORNL1 TaxID=2711231 RepID=UPI0013E1B994|nr:WecB/TagA/CpsF family glycosyltransferase [Roseimicrobium sp. ORNL1]QIF02921.1 WecB/TagA/CpsF family glycosyltransferase [Roseimicrobium sp. ORNL1]